MRTIVVVLLTLAMVSFGHAAEPLGSKVQGYASEPVREPLDRGLIARPTPDGKVYLGWRLLASDPNDAAFDVYRRTDDGQPVKLNREPVRRTTDFVDDAAPQGKEHAWSVRPARGGKESRPARATPAQGATGYVSIKLDGAQTFQKVGIADLDGDGQYDFVIKQPNANIDPWYKYWTRSPDTYKLEAYRGDGKFLWRFDLGWAIERGIWYSPYVVYDLDGDGKAEVAVKTGEGDPRDPAGKVTQGPEYLTILDGLTGEPRARVDWPSREGFEGEHGYNYASRNQLGVAYLDGKTPCLIVERGTYNRMKVVAYEFHGGRLRALWHWDNKDLPKTYWGQGAHWMHAADVDGDGRDEVLLGSAVLDDDGTALWSTGLGHPDHFYVGDIDPSRPGLEIYYGIETRQRKGNGMCLVDARTGTILWGITQPTQHVHGHGLCSDIDAAHPGSECYSAESDPARGKSLAWALLHDAKGNVLSREPLDGFGPRCAYWDADPQREIVRSRGIFDYGSDKALAKLEGSFVAVADILGDWREEIITSVPGELRIYTTTIPAADRRPCLMQDRLYRMDVVAAAMGYYQVPMTSFDLATGKR